MNRKEFIKIITLISTVIFCIFLISCSSGDNHVVCVNDDTLKHNGVTYVRLTEDDPMVSLQRSHARQVYVTEPYIPSFLAKWMHEDALGSLGKTYISENGYFIERNFRGTYCRKDIYENLDKILSSAGGDVYMYEYYKDGKVLAYHLTEDEIAAVDKVFTDILPVASYDLGYLPVTSDTIDLLYFDYESETASFLYRLLITDHGYHFCAVREDGITEYYVVPDELEEIFDGITASYIERG